MRLITDDALAIITIWQEARGESQTGRVCVGEVIRTRMRDRLFSDGTVAGTVLAPKQFSGWNPGDPNRIPSVRLEDDDPAVRECAIAWAESTQSNYTKGANHYLNERWLASMGLLPPWFDAKKVTARVGRHSFLRL